MVWRLEDVGRLYENTMPFLQKGLRIGGGGSLNQFLEDCHLRSFPCTVCDYAIFFFWRTSPFTPTQPHFRQFKFDLNSIITAGAVNAKRCWRKGLPGVTSPPSGVTGLGSWNRDAQPVGRLRCRRTAAEPNEGRQEPGEEGRGAGTGQSVAPHRPAAGPDARARPRGPRNARPALLLPCYAGNRAPASAAQGRCGV
jgi:hypothetical protein